MLWKYAGLSATFTPTILTRQTHIQFMLQLILLAVSVCHGACPGPSASQSASCLSSVRSEGKPSPTTLAFAADRLSSSSWIHIVQCCLPSRSDAMVCLPRLVQSFLKALRQAMPIQVEMEAPTLHHQNSNSVLACQQQSSFMLLSSVSWCDKSMQRHYPCCWRPWQSRPVVGTPPPSMLSSRCFDEWPPVPRCSLVIRHQV